MKTFQIFSNDIVNRLPAFLVKKGVIDSYDGTALAIYSQNNKLVFDNLRDAQNKPFKLTYDLYQLHSRYCDIWENYNDHPFVAVMSELTNEFVHDYQEAVEYDRHIRTELEEPTIDDPAFTEIPDELDLDALI